MRVAASVVRGFRGLRLACLVAAALSVPLFAFAQANGKLQVHHVNVGQGDGILLISPLGQTALFDDGNYLNCTGIKNYLQGMGIAVVNYHFASHYHSDHVGCIDDLAAIGITIGTAGYDRGSSYSSGVYTAYVNTLGAKRQTIAKNQVITLDAGSSNPVYLTCVDLNGAGVYSPSGSDENAKSLVMRVSYGNFDEVIGGDLTGTGSTDVESTVGPECGDVEVYKVHHHGSTYSSNDNWLNAVTPEVGIIQVGDGNSYGHPTSGALTRLHNHGVKTYWTQTGAGASPNPTWDLVANGTIVVQADPGAGAAYTVSGPGFSHTYYNDGSNPPVNETLVATSMTMLKGSITAGNVTRLAADDAVRVSVGAGVESGNYVTDWYGSVTLNGAPQNLTITYNGNFTVSRTQYLYLYNWSTSAWVLIDQATVGTSDVTRTWTTGSPASFASASNEVRLRVRGSTRAAGSYTCRGDYMAFTYTYQPASRVAPIATDLSRSGGGDLVTASFTPDDPTEAAEAMELPLGVLSRVAVAPQDGRVVLSWAVDKTAHADGFNVYREDAEGRRQFVGQEAELNTDGELAEFRFFDATPGVVYWLGARSCSGPEALIGPLRVSSSPRGAGALALAAAPNPMRTGTVFSFRLEEAADVRLDLFDVAGRHVATPFRGRVAAGDGSIAWNAAGGDGRRVNAGVYFARLEGAGRTTFTRVLVTGD